MSDSAWLPRGQGLDVIGQLGGGLRTVALTPDAETMYVGIGSRVWRVAFEGTSARFMDSSPILGGVVERLEVHRGHLLAAAGQAGLVVFDIRHEDEGWLQPIGSLTQAGRYAITFSVRGDDLLLIDRPWTTGSRLGDRALQVDWTDPASPRAGWGIRQPFLIEGILVEDAAVLVTQAGLKLRALDMSAVDEPAAIEVDDALLGSSIGLRSLAGRPWLLHLDGLARLELVPSQQDPNRLRLRIAYDVAGIDEAPQDAVDDGQDIWVLGQSNRMWRVPSASPEAAVLTRGSGAGPMAAAGRTIAVAEGRSVRLMIVPPASAEEDAWSVGELASPAPHLPRLAGMHGACGLAGDYHKRNAITSWIDLSRPAQPGHRGYLDLSWPWDISAGPGAFYVAPRSGARPSMTVVACDVSGQPRQLTLAEPLSSIARSRHHALIATGSRLGLLDLRTPLRPELLLSWPDSDFDAAVISVTTDAERWAALLPGRILTGRFEPPSPPQLGATLAAPAGVSAIRLVGRTLLVAAPGTVSAIDLTEPDRPQTNGVLDLPGTPRTLAAGAPGRAWVIVDDRGGVASLRLLDLRSGELRERAWTQLPGIGWHVAASGRTALVSGGEAGLLVVRDPDAADGPTIHLPLLTGGLSP